MHSCNPLPCPFGTNSIGDEHDDFEGRTAPISVIRLRNFRSSSNSVSLRAYIGPEGGVVPGLNTIS